MQVDSATNQNALAIQQLGGSQMSDADKAAVEEQVNLANKSNVIDGRAVKQTLDKNDFLTLLVTQLRNQDPSAPLEDKEFIAQMAQFSQLEQTNNMAGEIQKLSGLLQSGQAVNFLGKNAEVTIGDQVISGKVTQVTSGAYPQVLINGTYYDFKDVSSVKQE